MAEPPLLTIEAVCRRRADATVLWATPSVRRRVEEMLPFPVVDAGTAPAGTDSLVVVGGGSLIDQAKYWRLESQRPMELIAIPSIWGSGAEASPIAVRTRNGRKEFRVDAQLLPDGRVIWPELAAGLSPDLARWACGDCFAHALEGFLSPLAKEELRNALARLLERIRTLPSSAVSEWFACSAEACAGQAQSSVGLVHGLAHVLEPVLEQASVQTRFGHARLCSLFLSPVLSFNRRHNPRVDDLFRDHGLDANALSEWTRSLFQAADYDFVLPMLSAHWMDIVRDHCSRTNCALIRPSSLDFFANSEFT